MDGKLAVVKARRAKKAPATAATTVYAVTSCADEPVAVEGAAAAAAAADSPSSDHIILHLNVSTAGAPDVEAFNVDTESVSAYPQTTAQTCPTSPTASTSGCAATTTALRVIDLLKDFEEKNKQDEWPQSTSIACYWCCHAFNNPPYGIPVKYHNGRFHVVGCFCSLECAAAHNFSAVGGSVDEAWERYSLLNMFARRLGRAERVQAAPSKLTLQMFGGHMSIDEFREFHKNERIVQINFPPLMMLTQQIEEVNECDVVKDIRYIPLDSARVSKYKERMTLRRSKPVNTHGNTLDKTMNIRTLSS